MDLSAQLILQNKNIAVATPHIKLTNPGRYNTTSMSFPSVKETLVDTKLRINVIVMGSRSP